MYCSKCGKDNVEEAIFCVSCGTRYRVDTKCPMCNTEVKKDENFCPSCGYNVGGVKNQINGVYTKIMIIMNLCVYSLLMIFGSFSFILNIYTRLLLSGLGAGACLLLYILFIVIIGLGIYCLITKSKKVEIIHDCLSIFTALLLTLFMLYLSFDYSLNILGFILLFIIIAYTITTITLAIIKICKKAYSLEV